MSGVLFLGLLGFLRPSKSLARFQGLGFRAEGLDRLWTRAYKSLMGLLGCISKGPEDPIIRYSGLG